MSPSPRHHPSPALRRCRACDRGGATLLATAVLLLSAAGCALALLSFLLSARQLATLQLEREIALHAAEAALLDAEADIAQSLRAVASGDGTRLADWPLPGQCGSGPLRGLCRTERGGVPAWRAWLEAGQGLHEMGVGFGDITGNRLPQLPPEAAGVTLRPRYLIERLPDSAGDSPPASGYGETLPLPRLRFTAIGLGRGAVARAVLQSEFQP
ncbi:pilus assembly protein [Cupriavidus sp. USMAA2-4]|uniref:pilus assembly protein n=1 Tax=Cupriavidus sp. USMAA2-4 TaxID=876364 RepID=UPI0009FE19F5|nr:pilus assembly protein [Cupriavidus sp. USMAA2-4]